MTGRADGRRDDELRSLELLPDWLENAHGSVLYSQGKTRVLCTAMVRRACRAGSTAPAAAG